MKIACFTILLVFACKLSFAQKWTPLGTTKIEYALIAYNTKTIVIFKQDSTAIAVPFKLFSDFQALFLQNEHSFERINDSCLHFRTFMLSDSISKLLKSYQIEHVVYFIQREIKKNKNEETWVMTNVYGQGQHCWPAIVVRRSKGKVSRIKFVSVIRGFCEI